MIGLQTIAVAFAMFSALPVPQCAWNQKKMCIRDSPGAPDLITRRGAALLQEADCIIYAGSLVNPALLDAGAQSVFAVALATVEFPQPVGSTTAIAENEEEI